jgi:protein-S-isoprenylcysteine O-methyltransferase Ste14
MAPTPSIHTTLAHSYLTYFVFSMIGLFADTYIGFDVSLPYASTIAVTCFGLGAFLIGWAQYTSRHTKEVGATPYFLRGPYRYMRNPTHLGMVILVVGYTAVSGSIVFCAITIVGYLVSNVFFKRYESLLKDTYDREYEVYKKDVPKIL